MDLPGATTEVATLRKALSEAEDKAAKEHIEREKQEARVGKVRNTPIYIVKKKFGCKVIGSSWICQGPQPRWRP